MIETTEIRKDLEFLIEKVQIHFESNAVIQNELISIKEFLELLHQVYSSFKRDYNELEKVNIGNYNNFDRFISKNSRLLTLHLGNQEDDSILPEMCLSLTIEEDSEGKINTYFNTMMNNNDNSSKQAEVKPEIWKGYLDFFEKYQPLFSFISHLILNPTVEDKKNNSLNIRLVPHLGSFINNIDAVVINLNCESSYTNYQIKLYVDFSSEEIKINYDKSKVLIDDEELTLLDNSIFDNVYENIRICRNNVNFERLESFNDEINHTKRK